MKTVRTKPMGGSGRRAKAEALKIALAYRQVGVGLEAISVACQPADFLTEFVERGRRAQVAVDEFIDDYNKRHPTKPARRRRRPKRS